MKRFLYFVFLILVAATGCKKNSNDVLQDISGIYTVNFTGSYMVDTVEYTWSREQNMRISKSNDSLYNLCVCEHDSCIENTVTTVRVNNTHEIAGNFCYEKTSKFDWEMEVLVRHAWAGNEIVETVIECYYPKAEERVSHFRKFEDTMAIVWVHVQMLPIKWTNMFLNLFRRKNK
ncbi:MAG TPA: hypothetical protein PK029_00350 [Bacteroidales bacterium]|nr:hypothetical protein [Bacteroidales bacterium]